MMTSGFVTCVVRHSGGSQRRIPTRVSQLVRWAAQLLSLTPTATCYGSSARSNGSSTRWCRPRTRQIARPLQARQLFLFTVCLPPPPSPQVAQESLQGYKYDHVLVSRDDAQWLQRFDLNALLRSGGPTVELYVPECSRRWLNSTDEPGAAPPMLPSEMCDHVQLLTRNHAKLLGRYYSRFFSHSRECHVVAKGAPRACTSEELLRWTMVTNGVKWRAVEQTLLPYERSAHIKTPSHGVHICYHKFCQTDGPGKLKLKNHHMCQSAYIARRLDSVGYFGSCLALKTRGGLTTAPPAPPARVALHTVTTGSYDNATPTYNCSDVMTRMSSPFRDRYHVSCLAFVDSHAAARQVAQAGWTPMLLPPTPEPVHQQRKLKITGWNSSEIDEFDLVVYHDGKSGLYGRGGNASEDICFLERKLAQALDLVANGSVDLVAYMHPDRSSTAEELDAITCKSLCSAESLSKVRTLHHAHGYPDQAGLADTSNLVWRARGRSPALRLGMSAWIDAMETTGCMRDQLNFEYAMWKHKVRYRLLPDPMRPFTKVRKHTIPHKRYYTDSSGKTRWHNSDNTTAAEISCFVNAAASRAAAAAAAP